jgi:hypothetical protein
VVVDKFTKFAHFLPLKHPYTAASVAKIFLDQVYKLNGMPQSIISDRDPIFNSNFWKELLCLAKVQLRFSTAYHPQLDGQTERVNQCPETFLRCFVSACPKRWLSYLSLTEYWYNTSYHSAIGMSPFEAMYGRPPWHFGLSVPNVAKAPGLEDWLQERKSIIALIKQHLSHATLQMKSQAGKNRTEQQFAVGDWVCLKLQPYVQSSLEPRSNKKLAFKFFGPFQIMQKIGAVAYNLQLLDTSNLHPVFHVSQLKQAIGSKCSVTPSVLASLTSL